MSNPHAAPPIWITATLAQALLALEDGASLDDPSPDLGITRVPAVRAGSVIRWGGWSIPREVLEHARGNERVYRATALDAVAPTADDALPSVTGLRALEVRGGRFAKLQPTLDAPALVLDGISMHIAKKDTPWRTTRAMAAAVRPAGRNVLDCCGGLGYVAIHSVAAGARSVTSVEACPEVIALRADNPWSAALTDPRIALVEGDIREVLAGMADGSFEAAVHDPPRLTRRTGDLYGRPFYRELFRVLARGSLLLHYLGRPGVTRGRLHTAGVPDRLLESGFVDLAPVDAVQSILARKPR